MKALTLTQPWATLVARGVKHIETRSWGTSYRGPLAIHAAQNLGPVGGREGLRQLVATEPFWGALRERLSGYTLDELEEQLPRGAIVATVRLDAVVPVEEVTPLLRYNADVRGFQFAKRELAFGNYEPGRQAWILRELFELVPPLECKGGRGLWDVPDELERAIRYQADPELALAAAAVEQEFSECRQCDAKLRERP